MPSETPGSLELERLFDEFVRERQYLQNVAQNTIEWYRYSFKAFQPYLTQVTAEADLRPAVREAVMSLVASGKLTATSINDYVRCCNAFLKWLLKEGHLSSAISIQKLKTEKKTFTLLSDEQVRKLVTYSARSRIERRVHTIALVILDTGMRIDEALYLRKQDVDLESLLIRVIRGKGRKERVVPFTLPLRRTLFRHIRHESHPQSEFVFSTQHGTAQTYRNALRQIKVIGKRIGAPGVRFHQLRHQFATNYLRSGGSVALLRRILGHADISTTMVYEHLRTDDLKNVHHQFSLLAQMA